MTAVMLMAKRLHQKIPLARALSSAFWRHRLVLSRNLAAMEHKDRKEIPGSSRGDEDFQSIYDLRFTILKYVQ
jgi:hypothetical protein